MNQILDELINTAPPTSDQLTNTIPNVSVNPSLDNITASNAGGNKAFIQQKVVDTRRTLFDIEDFLCDIAVASAEKNKRYLSQVTSINGYDIASNCIRQILFKLLNYPIESYCDSWLPVMMRANLGNSIHDFIQDNSRSFTEWECSMKVPSIKTSVRLDNLINDNVLVEIKSCTFSDYDKILRTRRPRDADFYQAMFYRYLLHTHLPEIQSQPLENLRTPPPKLPKYNIDTLQIIYAAHDLLSSDMGSVSEAIKHASDVKRILNSKYNQFHFITAITIDLTSIDLTPYENYVIEKVATINGYIAQNRIAPMDDKFVKDNCFFCLYKKICKTL